MKRKLIKRAVLSATISTVALSACSTQAPPANRADLVIRPLAAPVSTKSSSDMLAEIRAKYPRKPYRGGVSFYIDPSLMVKDGKSSARKKLLYVNSKHDSNGLHNDHHDLDRYFNPDNVTDPVVLFQGDTPLEDGTGYVGAVAVNGAPSEFMAETISLRVKNNDQQVIDELKSKYHLEILQNSNGDMVAKIDLAAVSLSNLPEALDKYNELSLVPTESVGFSSLAMAKTASVLMSILVNYQDKIDYAIPTRLSTPPSALQQPTVFNDSGNEPITTRPLAVRPDTGLALPEFAIDSLEGRDGTQPNPKRLRMSDFPWANSVDLAHSRLYSTGKNTTIAVIDGGFKRNGIPDLPDRKFRAKRNFHDEWLVGSGEWKESSGTNPPPSSSADFEMPTFSILDLSPFELAHGQISMAFAAAEMDDGIGGVGVAPDAKLIQCRAAWPLDHGRAILWALDQGADVILLNREFPLDGWARFGIAYTLGVALTVAGDPAGLALGSALMLHLCVTFYGPEADAVHEAYIRGVPLIAPAGNHGIKIHKLNNALELLDFNRNYRFPASWFESITVGGAQRGNGSYDQFWDDSGVVVGGGKSNYGPAIDIYAPSAFLDISRLVGVDKPVNGDIMYVGGTSFAVPQVAGMAALMKSMNRYLGPEDIRNLLKNHYIRRISDPDGEAKPLYNAYEILRAISPVDRAAVAQQHSGYVDTTPAGNQELLRTDAGHVGERLPLKQKIVLNQADPHITLAGWWMGEVGGGFDVISARETSGPPRPGPFKINGFVQDATTGQVLPNIEIQLRNGCGGTVVQTARTNSSGFYEFINVHAGTYGVQVSQSGYVQSCATTTVNSSSPLGVGGNNGFINTSPALPSNAYRFVLTWNNNPKDLDSHLSGPMSGGGRFHVYWANKSYSDSKVSATLDQDDRDMYGPEVITNTVDLSSGAYPSGSSDFRYAVHDYDNRLFPQSTALSISNATLQVFKGSQEILVMHPPSNVAGNVWQALSINGNTGSINAYNYISVESDSSLVLQALGAKQTSFGIPSTIK